MVSTFLYKKIWFCYLYVVKNEKKAFLNLFSKVICHIKKWTKKNVQFQKKCQIPKLKFAHFLMVLNYKLLLYILN